MPQSTEPHSLRQAILWRVAAVGPFAVAVLANFAYRAIQRTGGAGAPSITELGLCLVAFTATWVGVLLLLHGRRLFHVTETSETLPVTHDPLRAVSSAPFRDRHAMAQLLTAQALARARAAHRQRVSGAADRAG